MAYNGKKFCLAWYHWVQVAVDTYIEKEFTGNELPFHLTDMRSMQDPGADPEICLGPFAECAPPEMTEEQWQAIIESEEQHGN